MTDQTKPQGVVFLSGKKVNLRPMQKSNVPFLTRWINDPEVRIFLSTSFPMTAGNEEEWYNNQGKDRENIVLIIETKDGFPIGTMGLHHINWVNRTALTGALIGEKDYWGRGYGTDAKMQLLNYAFNTLNLRRIGSETISYNKRSLHYNLHCGYKVEGRKRRHVFKDGKYRDLIILGLFKSDWLPIWKKYQETGGVR